MHQTTPRAARIVAHNTTRYSPTPEGTAQQRLQPIRPTQRQNSTAVQHNMSQDEYSRAMCREEQSRWQVAAGSTVDDKKNYRMKTLYRRETRSPADSRLGAGGLNQRVAQTLTAFTAPCRWLSLPIVRSCRLVSLSVVFPTPGNEKGLYKMYIGLDSEGDRGMPVSFCRFSVYLAAYFDSALCASRFRALAFAWSLSLQAPAQSANGVGRRSEGPIQVPVVLPHPRSHQREFFDDSKRVFF